jgi:hypothetical protein
MRPGREIKTQKYIHITNDTFKYSIILFLNNLSKYID